MIKFDAEKLSQLRETLKVLRDSMDLLSYPVFQLNSAQGVSYQLTESAVSLQARLLHEINCAESAIEKMGVWTPEEWREFHQYVAYSDALFVANKVYDFVVQYAPSMQRLIYGGGIFINHDCRNWDAVQHQMQF